MGFRSWSGLEGEQEASRPQPLAQVEDREPAPGRGRKEEGGGRRREGRGRGREGGPRWPGPVLWGLWADGYLWPQPDAALAVSSAVHTTTIKTGGSPRPARVLPMAWLGCPRCG